MNKYETLDAAIKLQIKLRPDRHPIYSHRLIQYACEALGFMVPSRFDEKEVRLIDRRMQAMRKAGEIKYEGTKGRKWVVVDLNNLDDDEK